MISVSALVACSDLTGYARFAGKQDDEEVFRLLSAYYEFLGDIVVPGQGQVVKFMGDAVLMTFREADAGVRALLQLQTGGDAFLAERGMPCRHHIRAHFGKLTQGEIGTRTDKRLDIFGSTVNTVFLLKTTGFAITPDAFRKLKPETRRLFKKHTPPVTYIPAHQFRRD